MAIWDNNFRSVEDVKPYVFLINSLFPGILADLNTDCSCIVYASTQRLMMHRSGSAVQKWVNTVAPTCMNYIHDIPKKEIFEKDAIRFLNNLFQKYPLPEAKIYDISKALGERLVNSSSSASILRISSCYGPGCSSNRTMGRLIMNRIGGEYQKEIEERRDFLYIQDFCESVGNLKEMYFSIGKVRYCCSGTNARKSDIIQKINKYTPYSNGHLEIVKNVVSYDSIRPSGEWIKKAINRRPTGLDDGIRKTIKYVTKTYFSNNIMSQTERLREIYSQEKQKVVEQGIITSQVEDLKQIFFRLQDNSWIASDAFWKPTGLVFGYPFPTVFSNSLENLVRTLMNDLRVSEKEFWKTSAEHYHTTLISYTHYLSSGSHITPMPEDELEKATDIIPKYRPISLTYKGVLIRTNGSVLAKGYPENKDFFDLQEELTRSLHGIQVKQNPFVHIKLGQILEPIPYEQVERINRVYNDTPITTVNCDFVRTYKGLSIRFKDKF